MDYIAGKYPDLVPLYDEIYNKHNRSYFEALEVKAEEMAALFWNLGNWQCQRAFQPELWQIWIVQ